MLQQTACQRDRLRKERSEMAMLQCETKRIEEKLREELKAAQQQCLAESARGNAAEERAKTETEAMQQCHTQR